MLIPLGPIGTNQFRCDECGQIFNNDLTDEEALEQFAIEFPGVPIYECVLICEDCYQLLVKERGL